MSFSVFQLLTATGLQGQQGGSGEPDPGSPPPDEGSPPPQAGDWTHGLIDFLESNSSNYYTIPTASALNLPNAPWAIGVFVRLNENSGQFYQYLLSARHPTANFPQLNLLTFESENSALDSGGDAGDNKWAFLITDDAGVSTGTRTDQTGFIADLADGLERLLVLQNTGSSVELWACAPGGTAQRLINHTITLGAITFSGLGVDWQFGRRYDGNISRYYEEEAGGIFKVDAALSSSQIAAIADGDDPKEVFPTTCQAAFAFASGAGATEVDEVSGTLTATRSGTFTPPDPSNEIANRNPTLYITGAAGLTDSSSNSLTVSQQDGTVQTGQPMARGDGIRLNGAYLQVDNTTAHWSVDGGALDEDVQCEFGAGMDCIIPSGVLADNLVLMSMDFNENAHIHGWVIWAHSDGSVELQVRQPWQPARMRSPLGQVSEGVQFHIQMVLGRDGMMLYLDGKRLEDGIKNSLVWHGLDRRERNTQSRNVGNFRVGATGNSANSDIIVGHVFAFVRSGHANELLDADCQAMAGAGGAPIAHRVWGRTAGQVNITNVANLQTEINNLSSAGGGRLIMAAGTYIRSADLDLKANVELVGAGSGSDPANNTIIQLTNDSQIKTVTPNLNTFSALSGTIAETSKTLTVNGHGLGADDVLVIMGTQGFHQLYTVNGEIPNPNEKASELMPVERIVDANTIRIDRKPQFSYTAAQREVVGRFSPITDVGLRNLRIQRSHSGNGTNLEKAKAVFEVHGVRRFRLSNVNIRENATVYHPSCFRIYGCVDTWTDPEASCTISNVGQYNSSNVGWQPYNCQPTASRGACFHNCILYGGGWHAFDCTGNNIFSEWPGTASSSNFVLSGQLYVVDSIVTGGPESGWPSVPGTRNRLNCHGGIKHYRFFNITMPQGGGYGFGGGYGDWVDIQIEGPGTLEPSPGMSHTYGAWRNYVWKCNHTGGHANGWLYAFTQGGAKASMRDCVLSNVTKNSSTANNSGGTAYANNTLRNVSLPHPSVGMGGNAAAPTDPMT